MKKLFLIPAAAVAAAVLGAAGCGAPRLVPADGLDVSFPLTVQTTLSGLGPAIPPLVSGPEGLILMASKRGYLQAFDFSNTEKKTFIWRYYVRQAEVPPVVAGGIIVWAAADKRIFRIDETSGKAVWTKTLTEPVLGEMGVVGGNVVFREGEKSLAAVDPQDGRVLWRIEDQTVADWRAESSRIILRTTANRLKVVDPDGKPVRDYALGETAAGLMGLDGRRLFVGLEGGRFGCFDLERGKERWSIRLGTETIGRPVSDGRQVYVILASQIIAALDARRGHLLWWQPLAGRGEFTPRIVGDHVYVSSLSDKLQAFSRQTGKAEVAYTASRELAAPAEIFGTTLYVIHNHLVENYVIIRSFNLAPPEGEETALNIK